MTYNQLQWRFRLLLGTLMFLCLCGLTCGGNGAAFSPVQQRQQTLSVVSLTPSTGAVGTVVKVSGEGFSHIDNVAFNGKSAATYSIVSEDQINVVVPSGATTGHVSVTTNHGTAISKGLFTVAQTATPQISAFSPGSGQAGTTVTISGAQLEGASAVKFHGASASFTTKSNSQIVATVPKGATTGDISVSNADGTGVSLNAFTVTGSAAATAQIVSFAPSSGPVATLVTISGSGFTGATAVAFNGVAVSFTVDSDSQISTSVPADATTGTITVTTPSGTLTSPSSFTVTTSSATGGSRGYVTTPGELADIAQKAAQGIQPYQDAVESIENFANTGSSAVQASTANPTFWPYGTMSGSQGCSGTLTPSFLGNGAPLIEAKALVYGLLLPTDPTTADQYADSIRTELLALAATSSYNGATFSGSNQCILNLSWYVPGWIIAADLIEGYSGWSATDKQTFQQWLATVAYPKTSWASDRRANNWGAAGSVASGMIADYLTGSGTLMVNYAGVTIDSHDAYALAKQRQLDRMDGNDYMDDYNCGKPGQGFRPDGGIPEELARGSTSCNGLWLAAKDASWTYTQTHLQGTILDAEFLLRRGDPSIYNNLSPTGHGSLQRAYTFILANPNPGGLSWPWNIPNEIPELEILYRYYRDPLLANQLGVGTAHRLIGGKSGQMLHFGTITHGFAVGEDPGPPPTVAAP